MPFLNIIHLEIFHILISFWILWKEIQLYRHRTFQHANTDHVIFMSYIEFTDDSFNINVREFNVCQVLIGNGISWWENNTVFFNNWALFWKRKELKKWVFSIKSVTNLLWWIIGKLIDFLSFFLNHWVIVFILIFIQIGFWLLKILVSWGMNLSWY